MFDVQIIKYFSFFFQRFYIFFEIGIGSHNIVKFLLGFVQSIFKYFLFINEFFLIFRTCMNSSYIFFVSNDLLFKNFNIIFNFFELNLFCLNFLFGLKNLCFFIQFIFIIEKIIFGEMFFINFSHSIFQSFIFLFQEIDFCALLLNDGKSFFSKSFSIRFSILNVFLKINVIVHIFGGNVFHCKIID